jgi:hypothetical protein
MFARSFLSLIFQSLSLIPRNEVLEIVAVWTVSPKHILVEKPFDPTAGANLVGNALGANRPAHPAVPATTEYHRGTG